MGESRERNRLPILAALESFKLVRRTPATASGRRRQVKRIKYLAGIHMRMFVRTSGAPSPLRRLMLHGGASVSVAPTEEERRKDARRRKLLRRTLLNPWRKENRRRG